MYLGDVRGLAVHLVTNPGRVPAMYLPSNGTIHQINTATWGTPAKDRRGIEAVCGAAITKDTVQVKVHSVCVECYPALLNLFPDMDRPRG